MKLLFDFFPLAAFFVAFKVYDVYAATLTLIVATLIQVAVHWQRTHRVNPMHVTTAVFVLVFGTITLLLKDQRFIQWKFTVVFWLFSAAFLASQFIGDKPIVRRIMEAVGADDKAGQTLPLADEQWRQLNLMWVAYFAFMGALNIYVIYNFSLDGWFNFKFYGSLLLTLLFALVQGVWIARQLHDDTVGGDAGSDTEVDRG